MAGASSLIIEIREGLAYVAFPCGVRETLTMARRSPDPLSEVTEGMRDEIRESRWCLPDAAVIDVSEIERASGQFISILILILQAWSQPGTLGTLVAAPAFRRVWQSVRLAQKWPDFEDLATAEEYLRLRITSPVGGDSGSRRR